MDRAMEILAEFGYLAAASLFIIGLKLLSSPRTAPRGNQLAALGMFIAVIGALLDGEILEIGWIIAGVVVGGAIGIIGAQKVAM
ncbi:MAG TPA: NAD(P)(+) transhydrogenase (Re/Si-specific) subunit beta, partial [Planctomycetota bacterium]|nr:NAD(P)(+) transhydrogenase (Re/Si-specific) subunit beta [Planctomycetota bacterium]